MRFPAQKHDRIILDRGFFNLRQHALFGGFNQLKALQIKFIVLDHVENQAVAVIARLDTVNFAAQLVLELGQILEALKAGIIKRGGHGQRIFCAREIGTQHLDALVIHIGLAVGFHCRHPVAQKHVNLLVVHGGIGHRHSQHVSMRLITETLENDRGGGGGGGDICPAHIGKFHRLAAWRIASHRNAGQKSGQHSQ